LEDSFYENAGFLWLFLASLSFFYTYFRKGHYVKSTHRKKNGNIFFLILGLLFFFGAGEEINWGQRIFNFETPEIMQSNVQHEFSIHNLPLFNQDLRANTPGKQEIIVKKTGLSRLLISYSLFDNFWFLYCIIMPLLTICNNKVSKWLGTINFPIAPIWVGVFLVANKHIFNQGLPYMVTYPIVWPLMETMEAAYSFFFFILSIWFINNQKQNRHSQEETFCSQPPHERKNN